MFPSEPVVLVLITSSHQTSFWFALTFCGFLSYLTGPMAPYAKACLCSMAPLSGSGTGTAFV